MNAAAAGVVEPRALEGRVVLVVGANGGLGEAASRACAQAGAKLVLLGRRVPKLNRLHAAIAGAGGDGTLYPLDLEGASPDDYAEMAARIASEFGRLDGLLHCAAVCLPVSATMRASSPDSASSSVMSQPPINSPLM